MQCLSIRNRSLVSGVAAASLWAGTTLKARVVRASYASTCRHAASSIRPVAALLVSLGAAFGSIAAFGGSPPPPPLPTVSGSITLNNCSGVPVPPITVSINTSPVQMTTTDGSGNYSFANIGNGTYTVTPSITGASSVFYPATQTMTVNGSNVSMFFNAVIGYTVSGTVSYSGAKTGQINIALNNNCSNGVTPGTSIAAPGAFTIQGVPPGTYTAEARMDNLSYGAQNASNPTGSTPSETVSSANLSGVTVTLADPAATTLSSGPGLAVVSAFNQGVAMPFDAIKDNNGVELATSYNVQWSTSSSFTPISGSHTFAATGPNGSNVWILNGLSVGGLAEGGTYYFRAQGMAGSSTSGWSSTIGPVTIGAPTGGNAVSGTVTFSGTATGPMYVGFYDPNTSAIYAEAIANPVSPQAYSVQVPNGSYVNFAIIDQNNDGLITAGDISNTNNNKTIVAISGDMTSVDPTLPSSNSKVNLATQNNQQTNQNGTGNGCALNFSVKEGIKLPVAVELQSGPNVLVPADMGQCTICGGGSSSLDFYANLYGDRPNVGDAYRVLVTYSDGTSETVTATVNAVLDAFATNLSPNGTGGSTTPTFSWTDPASASSYTYQFALWDANFNTIWQIPGNNSNSNSNGFSSTITSIPWDTDPTGGNSLPTVPSLTVGATYNWQVQVADINGNSAQNQISFQTSAPPVPATLTSPTQGTQFGGSSQLFTWSAGTSVTRYDLWLGTTGVGSHNLYFPAPTTLQSVTVNSLPTDGVTIYARLNSLINGVWQSIDYTFTANGTPVPAALLTPVPVSTPPYTQFAGSSQSFTWSSGSGVSAYDLWLGTGGVGSHNLYYPPSTTLQGVTVTGLPTDGVTIFARLNSLINGVWQSVDYSYTAFGTTAPAVLLTPAPNPTQPYTQLGGSSQLFTWSAGSGVTQYDLWLGTGGVGSHNLYFVPTTSNTQMTVNGLPTNGVTIYARLNSLIDGVWQSIDYKYTASGTTSPAVIQNPTPGAILGGSSQTFTWVAGSGVAAYDLWVGTAGVGSHNLYYPAQTTLLQATVNGLPTNGTTVYVRLNSLINGTWQHNDYTYTAQ